MVDVYLIELGVFSEISRVCKGYQDGHGMAGQHRVSRVERRHGYRVDAESRVIPREGDEVVGTDGGVVLTALAAGREGVLVGTMQQVIAVLSLLLQGLKQRLPQSAYHRGETVRPFQSHLK